MSDIDEVQNHLFFSEMELEETRRERDDLEERLGCACDEIIDLKRKLEEAMTDRERCRIEHAEACKLAAMMHAAAHGAPLGAVGPSRGVVEDVEDLYTECQFWRRAAEQALRLWDRAQDKIEELESPPPASLARKCPEN